MTVENTGEKGVFKQNHMMIYSNMKDKGVLNLSLKERYQMNALWEKAKSCNLTDDQMKRVLLSEISWRYWKSSNKVCEFNFLTGTNRLKQNKALYNDMKKLGITRIHEGDGGLLTDDPSYFSPPKEWTK